MTDEALPHQDLAPHCHMAEQRFVPLAAEIRGTREALIGIRVDMAHVRTAVDGLDRLVRGNGTPGIAAQVRVHEQRLDDLVERIETHEVEDRQEHMAGLTWRRSLLAAVIVCLLGWVLTTAVAIWRTPSVATGRPSPAASATPVLAAPTPP